MIPAYQRFHDYHLQSLDIYLRLVVEDKVSTLKSGTHIVLEHQLPERFCGSSRSIELVIVAVLLHGTAKGRTRIPQKGHSVFCVVGKEADSNTSSNKKFLVVEFESVT